MIERKTQRLTLPANIDRTKYDGIQPSSRLSLLDIYRDTARMKGTGRNITSAYSQEVKDMLPETMQGYLDEGRTITVDYRGGVSITKPRQAVRAEKALAAD